MSIAMDSSSSNNIDIDMEEREHGDEGEANHQERSRCCFQRWMQIQHQDLSQLLQSLDNPHGGDETIKPLLRDRVSHFKDYVSARSRLTRECASPFFAPAWCTSLENSILWIGGCRPSIFVRLLYALIGSQAESHLRVLLEGGPTSSSASTPRVGDLSPAQMERVDALHMRTIRDEEKLTGEMASSQKDLGNHLIALIANMTEPGRVGEPNADAEKALEEHEKAMHCIMEKADRLRIRTLEEVVQILSPLQAVEFLGAGKKLHLSLHHWGKHRDEKRGRSRRNYV